MHQSLTPQVSDMHYVGTIYGKRESHLGNNAYGSGVCTRTCWVQTKYGS